MPTHVPLQRAVDSTALASQLNDQELLLGREVLSVNGVTTNDPADQLNSTIIEFNLNADQKPRLTVQVVPTGATQADMDAASSLDAARQVKNAFLKFIAPLLDNGEMLCRSEVFLGGKKAEIVLLRAVTAVTPPPVPGTRILKGGAGWGLIAQVIGNDIVVRGAKAAAFGGDNDQANNGQTASGFPTRGHPELMGCALPLGGFGKSRALAGTPLPHMPFGITAKGADNPNGAHVEVTDPVTGKGTIVPVVDLGPAKGTGHALDLTLATAQFFKANATANNFSMKLDYRIIDGATFLTIGEGDFDVSPREPAPIFRDVQPPPPPPTNAPNAPRVYDVWFATNRRPVAANDPAQRFGNEREADGIMHYGVCSVEIPKYHEIGSIGSPWWKRWLKLKFTDDQLKIVRRVAAPDADTFFANLRDEIANLADKDRQILFYLHGFNVTFDDAALRAAQIGFDLQVPGATAFFSWPSKASVEGYFADADQIAASEREIAGFLTRLATGMGGATVHIIAHSMGNRGLARAIQRITAAGAKEAGVRFGQIILAAPDIEVSLFRDLAAIYPQVSRRVTMYVSAKDRALGLSRWLQDSNRAGFTPPVTVVPQIDTVEVTNIDVTILGHGYYAEARPLLNDIDRLLRDDAAPPRFGLEAAAVRGGGQGYWIIRR